MLLFLSFLLQTKEKEQKEDKTDNLGIIFGERSSGFIPAGFKQGKKKKLNFIFYLFCLFFF